MCHETLYNAQFCPEDAGLENGVTFQNLTLHNTWCTLISYLLSCEWQIEINVKVLQLSFHCSLLDQASNRPH